MAHAHSVAPDPGPFNTPRERLRYELYSPVYRFGPEGQEFEPPLTISIPYTGDNSLAAVFWEHQDTTGYGRLGGVPSSDEVTVKVPHFSHGFVANGVAYTDPPDTSCVRTTPLEVRTGQLPFSSSSAVSLFFTAEDCIGRPIVGFDEADFVVKEDGASLSSEAVSTILPKRGLQVFITLSLDMSSSTQSVLADLIAGAQTFVQRLQDDGLPVQVQVEVFAGDARPVCPATRPSCSIGERVSMTGEVWQPFTLDLDVVSARLDELGTYASSDPSSTDLHGAIATALLRSDAAQEAFETRNAGGALTAGYLVLFTDGRDTAGRLTLREATDAVEASANQFIVVGLDGADYDNANVVMLNPDKLVNIPIPSLLGRELGDVARRIAGQVSGTYLLGYCSPLRGGDNHSVSIELADAKQQTAATAVFSAVGFSGGCTKEFFETACDDKDCGGLACGACDDRTQFCNGAQWFTSFPPAGKTRRPNIPSHTCVDFCVYEDTCGGATLVNPLGYMQTCEDSESFAQCGATCVDTLADPRHCGGCNLQCAQGAACVNGQCECSFSGHEPCRGACVDLATNVDHCGSCDRTCPTNGICINGACGCGGPSDLVCNNTCVDAASDPSHCGACGSVCGTPASGAYCVAGDWVCPPPSITCGEQCVDPQTDPLHCNGCNNNCSVLVGDGAVCLSGSCQCPPNHALCGGKCVHLNSDSRNCGRCGVVCPNTIGGQSICCSGTCQVPAACFSF